MELTHVNEEGKARMVEVGEKEDTARIAVAFGSIRMKRETARLIKENLIKKGDVLTVSKIAGILGAKKTSDLIPLCHNIVLSGVEISFKMGEDVIEIMAQAHSVGKTGVEMESLTAVSVAALTIYDMCKAVDKEMVIGDIKLLKKTGGKSGNYTRQEVKHD